MSAPGLDKLSFSFELFPPKTPEGMAKLSVSIDQMDAVGPEYFSVTYGAGGSTRDTTLAAIDLLIAKGIDAAPHLACIGSMRQQVKALLDRYKNQGIRRLVALRGDLPSGMGLGAAGDFRYANELVRFIRQETGDHFRIEVAAYPEVHPQAHNADQDLANFQRQRGHHPILLQCRRLLRLRRPLRRPQPSHPYPAGHHAHHQFLPARPFF